MPITGGIKYTLCRKCENDLSDLVNHKLEEKKIKCSICSHENKSANGSVL